MKKAVGHLIPFMEKEREEARVLNGSVEEEASDLVQAWGLQEPAWKTCFSEVGNIISKALMKGVLLSCLWAQRIELRPIAAGTLPAESGLEEAGLLLESPSWILFRCALVLRVDPIHPCWLHHQNQPLAFYLFRTLWNSDNIGHQNSKFLILICGWLN